MASISNDGSDESHGGRATGTAAAGHDERTQVSGGAVGQALTHHA
jgi:hypothetical protein